MKKINIEPVMEKDRSFFANNPDKKSYIRPIHPLEILEGQANGQFPSPDWQVKVTEVAPGMRIREVMGTTSNSMLVPKKVKKSRASIAFNAIKKLG